MKFTLASLGLLGAVYAKHDGGFAVLRFNDKEIVNTRLDPIVNPGAVSPHLHNVNGGSNFAASVTGEEMLKSNCTNSLIVGDMSAYWTPNLFFEDPKTGKFEMVEMSYTNIYYFFDKTDDDIQAFPVGLSILAGDVNARLPPKGVSSTKDVHLANFNPKDGKLIPARFSCPRTDYNRNVYNKDSDGTESGIADSVAQGEGIGFPLGECDGKYSPLRADIHLPSCYVKSAGLKDYKNNMVYPMPAENGKFNCPEGTIHVPHLFYEIYWNTQKYANRWDHNMKTQPFVFSNGDRTGYSLHADFLAAWDTDTLQKIIDGCNTGSSGMDKCPGVQINEKKERCQIKDVVEGIEAGDIFDKLPGPNPIVGFGRGDSAGRHLRVINKDGTQPTSGEKYTAPEGNDDKGNKEDNTKTTSAASVGSTPVIGNAPVLEDETSAVAEEVPATTSAAADSDLPPLYNENDNENVPATTTEALPLTETSAAAKVCKPKSTVYATVTVDATETEAPKVRRSHSHKRGHRHLH